MDLKTQQLQAHYGDTLILKNIDMHIRDGEFVGIIGPNGSGKSTLLKCIYRVLKPSKGAVLIDNIDLREVPLKESAKKLAVVSQYNDYSFDFSVTDIVLMGRMPHKKFMERDTEKDYEIVKESLEKVGMDAYIERSFSSLSGGEKQRIILARALAQKTNCLILDEPTNHLDIKYQLQFMSAAKSFKSTVVSAVHDLNIAALFCDKIYALKSGEIIKYGTPKQVLTKDLIKHLYDVDVEIIKDKETSVISVIYKL